MSKPTNPMAIGAFVIGALALLVIGLLAFGGGALLKRQTASFVIFFESSLNGLDVGAPVKMQGVKIGTVTQIALQLDPKTAKLYKPVVIQIDRSNFRGPESKAFGSALSEKERKENRDRLVAAGFRARLEMQSLLTGLLFVDLDRYPNRPAEFVGLNYEGLLELPSVPPTTEEIRNTFDELAREIRALPLQQMVADLSETLRELRDIVKSEAAQKSLTALAATLDQTQRAAQTVNRNLDPLMKNADIAVVQANALVRDTRGLVQDLRREIGPILAAAERAEQSATTTLNQARHTLDAVEDGVGPDSVLQGTLQDLGDAARSLRNLADFLERHPEALLSGKNQ